MNDVALERGLADVLTFRLGRRPLLTEAKLWRLVMLRFDIK